MTDECRLVIIEMEVKKRPKRDGDGREEAETGGLCPCHVSLCVFVHHASALLWLLTTCTSSIIHCYALTEGGGLITVQPEGRGGERDIMCSWTSERAAQPDALMCIMGVCVCVCVPVLMCVSMESASLCILQRARCPDV